MGNPKANCKTKVLCSQQQMYRNLASFFDNARSQVLACLSSYTLTLTTDIESLQAPKRAAKERGVKLRYITDITRENLAYCKKQMEMVDELRHLEGIKGNFILSDSEFMISPDISKEKPLIDGTYSNADQMLKQQWYVFETIWNHAIPAEDRIRELEENGDMQQGIGKDRKKVIDRFYVCAECRSMFIYGEEAEEHRTSTGHKKMDEYPIL
jgi:hypothetical protein